MLDLSAEWCLLLVRATLLLAVAFGIALGLMSVLRCRSWQLHRLSWLAVLAVGLLALIPITRPLEVPVLEAPREAETVAPRPLPAVFTETDRIVPGFLDENKPIDVFQADRSVSLPAVSAETVQEIPAVFLETPARLEAVPAEIHMEHGTKTTMDFLPMGLALAWLAGIVGLPLRWLYRTVRFYRFLDENILEGEPDPGWTDAWRRLQTERGITRPIPLFVAEHFGPALVRRRCGTSLIVPLEGWDRLSEAERVSVLRHELQHYRRGDIVKSFLVRLLALPHWFNPLAWVAARRFEDAAEWACDEAALVPTAGEGEDQAVATYARALVSLHETSLRYPRFTGSEAALQHPVFGQNLSRRVTRLLNFNPLDNKDSIMKKTLVPAVCLLLICTAFVQVRLVAKNTEPDAPRTVPVANFAAEKDGPKAVAIPESDLTEPAQTEEEVAKRLETRVDLELDANVTLEDFFQLVKDKVNVQIFFDRKNVELFGITMSTPAVEDPVRFRSVSLRQALRLVLHQMDLEYEIEEGIVIVTTRDAQENKRQEESDLEAERRRSVKAPISPWLNMATGQMLGPAQDGRTAPGTRQMSGPAQDGNTAPGMLPWKEYVIESPDILSIKILSPVPKSPYRLRVFDVLALEASNTPEEKPIFGNYSVEPGGKIELGLDYGSVGAEGLTAEELKSCIEQHLVRSKENPDGKLSYTVVTVRLVRITDMEQVDGQHIVSPDGFVTLGSYGRVWVNGLTVEECQKALSFHLSTFLEKPRVSVEIKSMDSKEYYVIVKSGDNEQVMAFPCTGNETVMKAIAKIQWPANHSNTNIVHIRPGDETGQARTTTLQWDRILTERGGYGHNLQLLPGDRLVFEISSRKQAGASAISQEGTVNFSPWQTVIPIKQEGLDPFAKERPIPIRSIQFGKTFR